MALKNILNIMKTDSESIVSRIDKFLIQHTDESSEDRSHGMNSPSSIGYCERSVIYGRMGIKKSSLTPPRLQRIFDNGNYVHDRLQTYLEKMGVLKLREVPVWNRDLQIIGHSDGLLQMSPLQLSILEIKSINADGFTKLVEEKPEHLKQANVYMYCLEELRKEVNSSKFTVRQKKGLVEEYRKIMDGFVTDGSRFTKEEKVAFKLDYFEKVIELLTGFAKPINTVTLLYENKNNQDLKSFTVKWQDSLIEEIKEKYRTLNHLMSTNTLPPRPEGATGKSCPVCRNCNYADKCY